MLYKQIDWILNPSGLKLAYRITSTDSPSLDNFVGINKF